MDNKKRTALIRAFEKDAALAVLMRRLEAFNVFDVLNLEHQEIRHSNVIAWLLNPKESHGLGASFLTLVIKDLLAIDKGARKEFSRIAKISTFDEIELCRERDRTDIMAIDHRNRWVLLIENKIHAGIGDDQLPRYLVAVKRRYPDFTIVPVLLSPPETFEDEDLDAYIPWTYERVEILVEKSLSIIVRRAKPFLNDYLLLLRRSVTMNDAELTRLCRGIYKKHRAAIDMIVEIGRVPLGAAFKEQLDALGSFKFISIGKTGCQFLPESAMALLGVKDGEEGPAGCSLYYDGKGSLNLFFWCGGSPNSKRLKLFSNILLPIYGTGKYSKSDGGYIWWKILSEPARDEDSARVTAAKRLLSRIDDPLKAFEKACAKAF